MSVQFPTTQEIQTTFMQLGFNETQTQGLSTLLERISNVAQESIINLREENTQLKERVEVLEKTLTETTQRFGAIDQKFEEAKQERLQLSNEMKDRLDNGLGHITQQFTQEIQGLSQIIVQNFQDIAQRFNTLENRLTNLEAQGGEINQGVQQLLNGNQHL